MISIVTDSSSDLSKRLATEAGIAVVPLTVRFGEDTFTDGVDLDNTGFWNRLATSDHLPETAAPSPGAFLQAFASLGHVDGIVCLCISSRLSATYQAAVLAAEEADVPVRVIDSQVVSMALGLAALEAAETARSGGTLEQVAAAGRDAAAHANVFAALDTLTYLERGGRIGRVSAAVGGLLDIKPLITLSEGVVAAEGRVRTRSKAVAAIAEHLASRQVKRAVFLHSGPRREEELALLGLSPDAMVAELGPVVGTHTGPGVIGIAYLER